MIEPILVHNLMKKNEAINYIKEIINDVGLPIESLEDFLMNFLEDKDRELVLQGL